jgi:hypothetical protein
MHSEALMTLLMLLTGCWIAPSDKAPVDDTAGDTGTGADAYGCIESARVPITDTSVPSEGMDFAPDAIVTGFSGSWEGLFEYVVGDPGPASFAIRPDGGTWEMVERTLYEGSDGMGSGADEECSSYYAWTTEAQLTDALGAFAEHFTGELDAYTVDAVTFRGGIALASVAGTTRPTAWDPADWPENTLSIDGNGSPDQWIVSATWQATNEDTAKDESSEADTATIEPSGMSELVGTMTAGRAAD